jgi:hypothetical protein
MGQYYKLVNFDKREFVESWPLDCGAKLMEWSYCRAGMACALMNLIAGSWKGDRVYAVGDYADLEYSNENWFAEYKEMADELGTDNVYGMPQRISRILQRKWTQSSMTGRGFTTTVRNSLLI